MTTHCKQGDLAVILCDEEGFDLNIGRIVEVFGPSRNHRQLGLTWIIVPVGTRPYLVMELDGSRRSIRISREDAIEHPDRWMWPIRPGRTKHSLFCYEAQERLIEISANN